MEVSVAEMDDRRLGQISQKIPANRAHSYWITGSVWQLPQHLPPAFKYDVWPFSFTY